MPLLRLGGDLSDRHAGERRAGGDGNKGSVSSFSALDQAMMRRALSLAERGLFTTTPNPRVGCVVVRDGRILGEGWHERQGGPHAEVRALENTAAEGATV